MARMNQRKREKTLMYFQTRVNYYIPASGKYVCQRCGASFEKRRICVDHKDNNNSNNRKRNLQPLCRSCNVKKNKKDPMKKPKQGKHITFKPSIPETIKRSDRIKRATKRYLKEFVTPGERVHIKDAIEHICFEADAEQQAVLRALEIQTGSHPSCRYMRFTEFDDERESENVFIQLKLETTKQ